MALSKAQFAKLKIGDRIIFDAGDEGPVYGTIYRVERDSGVRVAWDDGGKSLPFYGEEVGTYIDWFLPNAAIRKTIGG